MSNEKNIQKELDVEPLKDNANEELHAGRRALLKKLGKSAAFAPISIALVSMEAKACSFSC